MGDAIIKCNLLTTLEKGGWPLSRHRGLIVLLLDAVVFATCNFLLFLPYLCSGNIKLLNLVLHMGLLSACVFVFQLLLHTYETLWRYAESLEYLQLFKGLSFGFLLYAAINLLAGMNYVWISGALTGTSIALLIMLAYRFTYRVYRRRVVGTQGPPRAHRPPSSARALPPPRSFRIWTSRRRAATAPTALWTTIPPSSISASTAFLSTAPSTMLPKSFGIPPSPISSSPSGR